MTPALSSTAGCGFAWLCGGMVVTGLVGAAFAQRPRARMAGPAPRYDAWKIIGPGGGGCVVDTYVSPHDASVACVSTQMSGGYITKDGGESWRLMNIPSGCRTFAFDPLRPDVIYSGYDCVWRSEDAGKTWSMVYPDPNKDTYYYTRTDHADPVIFTQDGAYPSGVEKLEISRIAVHPKDSNVVALAYNRDKRQNVRPTVCISRDYCRTWELVRRFEEELVLNIDIDPDTSDVTIVTQAAVHVQEGAGWERLPTPTELKGDSVSSGRARDGRLAIYATVPAEWKDGVLDGGIISSRDGGRTWAQAAAGLGRLARRPGRGRAPQVTAVTCSGGDAETVYAAFRNLAPGSGREDIYNGIAKSTNGGASWTIVKRDDRLSAAETPGAFLRSMIPGGHIWFDAAVTMSAAAREPNTCYADDGMRSVRTRDGGRSWQDVNATVAESGGLVTTGLDVRKCFGVHFDPFDGKAIYATHANIGLYRSGDGGRSWLPKLNGVPLAWCNTSYWLELDREVRGLAWAAWSGTHDLPRTKMWRRRHVSSYRGGITISSDGGDTWRPADCGTDRMAVTHIILDPTSPAGRRTLYACGFGKGAFKSTDNGNTWRPCNRGIEFEYPLAWRMTRADDGTLYLVIVRKHEWGERKPSGLGAIYRSTDGAESWEKMNLPHGTDGPCGITLDPADNRRMYLAAWGRVTSQADVGGGIFLSEDAGNTWRNVLSRDQHIYDVTIDARNGTAYACGFEWSAYRSPDRGETWERIKGFNYRWSHRVIPDPNDTRMVYIATFGGGIWYGPAAGDPDALEDTVTHIPKKTDQAG